MLNEEDPPTALFGYNDLIGIGALRGIHECGLRVPEDVSVIGFDDIEAAAFVKPALTSVRVPKFEFGSLAVQAVLSMNRSTGVLDKTAVPPIGLVLRESTSVPAKETRPSRALASATPRLT
jgi:LacI family transcriptional regulator